GGLRGIRGRGEWSEGGARGRDARGRRDDDHARGGAARGGRRVRLPGFRAPAGRARGTDLLVTVPPPYPPVEPPPPRVELPDAERANREGIVALSRTMSPGLVLQAYRKGIFPWPIMQGVVPWASPDPRAVYRLGPPRWPRHVRRARGLGYTVTFDRSFREVLTACG